MLRLKELRKKKNMSQKEFGALWGASQNTVSNWENGNRELSTDLLVSFAQYFGVSVDYLLGGDAHPSDMNVSADDEEGFITEIVDTLKLFPKEEKLFAIAMLNGIKQKLYNEGKLK